MRMDDRKSQFRPQKPALMRMDGGKFTGLYWGRRALGYKGYKRHKRARDFAGCVGRS